MNSLEALPLDVQMIIIDIIFGMCSISHLMFSGVSHRFSKLVSAYAFQHQIPRTLECHQIASRGYLNILKWAIDCGYPVDQPRVCSESALHGHFEILKWACYKGYQWNVDTTTNAAKGGYFHILKWAVEWGCPIDQTASLAAAEFGHLEILTWTEEQHMLCYKLSGCALAAANGHLHIIQYLNKNSNVDYNWETYEVAALNGYEDIIKFLIKTDHILPTLISMPGFYHDDDMAHVCASAALGGHLSILRLLQETGFYWDRMTCRNATLNGHLEVLQWARKNGCQWDYDTELMANEKWGDIF